MTGSDIYLSNIPVILLLEYIKIQKLELAARQLRTTDKNVTQIGFELNFPSSSQFILLFKKKYHMSPLQYRKNFSDLSSVNYSNK